MGTSQLSSGSQSWSRFVRRLASRDSRSSKHIGCKSSSVAPPKVATGDHMKSTVEGKKALCQLDVTAGDHQDIPESLHGVASCNCSRNRLGILARRHTGCGVGCGTHVGWGGLVERALGTGALARATRIVCACATPTVGALGDSCICHISRAIPGGTALPSRVAGGHLGTLGVGIHTAWVGIRDAVSGSRTLAPRGYWTTPALMGALGGVSGRLLGEL